MSQICAFWETNNYMLSFFFFGASITLKVPIKRIEQHDQIVLYKTEAKLVGRLAPMSCPFIEMFL